VSTPLYPIVGSYDGPRITVDDYLKDPLRIPALVIDIMANEFIIETVLRNAGANQSGAVRYEKSVPLYANQDTNIRAEFAEVPAVTGSVGEILVAYSYERALAISVSDEMRRRQVIDPVNRQLTQVKNTMVRAWNKAFFSLLDQIIDQQSQPPVYQLNHGAGTNAAFTQQGQYGSYGTWLSGTDGGVTDERWDSAAVQSGNNANPTAFWGPNLIRGHISDAIWVVENAQYNAAGQTDNFFGFEPDTIIINHTAKLSLFKSVDFARPYIGDVASSSIQYTGVLPRKIMNLDVLVSRQCPPNSAYVLQRNRIGFYSDEVPLTASPLYRDEPRKLWRSDVQRGAAMGLDQPQAMCRIDNIMINPGGGPATEAISGYPLIQDAPATGATTDIGGVI
jgi:hypothetical protein